MGKTREHFKKSRDTKGTFHARINKGKKAKWFSEKALEIAEK